MNRYSTTGWRRMAAMLALAVLLGLPQVSRARTLELGDSDIVKIDSVVCSSDVDLDLLFKEANIIVIDSIELTYHPRSTCLLTITCDSDTIFNANLMNNLSLTKINKANNGNAIELKKGKKYEFSHGGRTWALNFVPPNSRADEETDTTKNTRPPEDEAKSHNLWTWILWGIAALLVLAILAGGCYFIKHGKSSKEKKPSEKPEDPIGTTPTDAGEGTSGQDTSTEQDKDKDVEDLKSQLQSIREIVDEMYQGSGTEESDVDKLRSIQIYVSAGKKAIELLKSVKALLPEAKDDGDIVPAIKKLIDAVNAQQSTEEGKAEKEKLKEDFAQRCVDKVNTSSNKDLKDLMKKAEDEVGANGKPTMAIEKFIELLRSQYREDTPGKGTQSPEITDSQLSDSTNRRKIMRWCIGMLSVKEYKDFDNSKNISVDEFFSRLVELLKKANNESQRPSDDEIITKAINEKKLTDEQKGILLKGLIEIINQKLDDSHKLTDTTIEAFVQSMVEKIQVPNTQEEATEQERQRNLTTVNSVLGSEMTQLDADGLRSAQANAILKYLKEKIRLEADNLDEALKELSTKAKQSKELADLLNKFKAESADELGEAIRKEQYESMSKPITYKLESLLPGQHIDSEQQLVNALIKLVEESKEEVSLVTDDLDERLSSLDSEHKTGKKPTVLLDRYTSLLKDKEKKLTDDIKEKEDEVNKLKVENAERKEKITELEEKNGDLMSATQSMLSELHAYADALGGERLSILSPCSESEEKQCEDIEDRLYESLDDVATRLKGFTVSDGTTPAEAKKAIQKELVDMVKEENSPINTICRYYAYSRLPFMTDDTRKYGVKFNRRNMSDLYTTVNNLFVAFGICFDIPALFVMGIEDSQYDNRTGETFSDLDNLCPNSCNHIGNIDTQNKPANVVVDIVNVGYTVEGGEKTTTSVLTH